jgi:lysophospholipase L1-like esterase
MYLKKGLIAIALVIAMLFLSSSLSYAANDVGLSWDENDLVYKKAVNYNEGDLTRLQKVFEKANNGEDITIAFLGGSITEGAGASDKENCYVSLVYKWWCEKFPKINVNLINAGIGGTSSYLGLHRLEADVLSKDVDLVFVEFAANDTDTDFSEDSYEQIIRRLLYGDEKPAVVLLFTTTESGYNMQQIEQYLGSYYELPMISYGNGVLAAINEGYIKWSDISVDTVHPNDYGHAIFANIITRYLDGVYEKLSNNIIVRNHTIKLKDSYTQHIYYNPHIESADTLTPVDANGYDVLDVNPYFRYNWYLMQKDSYITFEVEAANIGIVYQRVTDGSFGKYDVYVDGEYITTLDGNYKVGDGTSTQEQSLYISSDGKVGTHTIKFVRNAKSKNNQFVIAGLLIG